jgi:hypothetical protein
MNEVLGFRVRRCIDFDPPGITTDRPINFDVPDVTGPWDMHRVSGPAKMRPTRSSSLGIFFFLFSDFIEGPSFLLWAEQVDIKNSLRPHAMFFVIFCLFPKWACA